MDAARVAFTAFKVEDQVAAHDFLYAPCSQEMFEIQYGATGPRPNCFTNLTRSLAEFGVPESTVTIAFNFFMRSVVDENGQLKIEPPLTTQGKSMTLTAERDLFVAVTACATEGVNGGQTKALQVEIT
ncbi:urea carboxylase-associated family protein [Kibdelosporangium philippinense]|uniref:urea carboxylase-associated family protein n=1 Tax=Kibdelosporangium philippinense TaxID=211113 RepID=UPI0024C2AB30